MVRWRTSGASAVCQFLLRCWRRAEIINALFPSVHWALRTRSAPNIRLHSDNIPTWAIVANYYLRRGPDFFVNDDVAAGGNPATHCITPGPHNLRVVAALLAGLAAIQCEIKILFFVIPSNDRIAEDLSRRTRKRTDVNVFSNVREISCAPALAVSERALSRVCFGCLPKSLVPNHFHHVACSRRRFAPCPVVLFHCHFLVWCKKTCCIFNSRAFDSHFGNVTRIQQQNRLRGHALTNGVVRYCPNHQSAEPLHWSLLWSRSLHTASIVQICYPVCYLVQQQHFYAQPPRGRYSLDPACIAPIFPSVLRLLCFRGLESLKDAIRFCHSDSPDIIRRNLT